MIRGWRARGPWLVLALILALVAGLLSGGRRTERPTVAAHPARSGPAPRPAGGAAPIRPAGSAAPPPVATARLAQAGLRVRVIDDRGHPDPAAWAEAVDCPTLRGLASTEPDVLAYAVAPGTCSVRAVRQDGLARTEGPVSRVEVPAGETVDLELAIPSTLTGGIQLAFQPTEEGVRVSWVPAGSDLDRAGVRRGDLLLSVDDRPLAGLDPADVRATLTGPEGAEVRLEVLRAGADTGLVPEVLNLRHTLVEPE